MQRFSRSFQLACFPAALILIGATCAVGDSLSPPNVSPIDLWIDADTTLVAGARMQPRIQVTSGGRDLGVTSIRWSSTDTNIVAVRGDTLVGKALGRVTIEARMTGAMLPNPAPVTTHTIAVVPKTLIVEPSQIALSSLGESDTLIAFATDYNNLPIPNLSVTWESSDAAKLTVNALGVVTAREPTTAPVTITARVEGLEASVPATVTQRLAGLVITPAVIGLSSIGETGQLSVAARDARGNPIPAAAVPTVGWQSTTPGVVSVNAAGIVTALDNGVAAVRAIISTPDGVVADTAQVAVEQIATRVVVTAVAGTTIPAVTDAIPLIARGFDARDVEVRGKRPSWSSRDGAVAAADEDGRVTGFSVGSVWIVARIDASFDSVRVTVANDPQTIALQPEAHELIAVNDSVLLTASARNAVDVIIPNPSLSWQTSDPATVAIVGTGSARYAKALQVGTATISVSGGAATARSQIQVTNFPTVVAIVPDTVRLTYLTEVASPPVDLRNALGASVPRTAVTWSSDDNTIAQVAPNGSVTARAVGTTRIRATSPHAGDEAIVVVTNAPASLALPVGRDTITALGQSLSYSATVRNAIGALVTDAQVTWSSTNPNVATVSGDGMGTVSGAGFGSAEVIARAGTAADTMKIIVVNPTRIYADNSPLTGQRNGTMSRPYAKIQDAIDAADPSDTVYVRKGSGPYSETLVLNRKLTLLGQPVGFNPNQATPNTSVLPVIAHDTGSAAIRATTTSPQVIRYFAIRHTAEGPSIDVRGPELTLQYVYINPGEVTRIGGGVTVDNGATGARVTITNTVINAVRGYGIRLINVNNAIVSQVRITGVDSTPSTLGAGLEISGGTNNQVSQIYTRTIGGSHLHFRHTTAFLLSDFDLAGRDQLIRIDTAGGPSTFISGGLLDLAPLAGDQVTLNSTQSDVAGIHVHGSPGVTLSSITITEGTGQSAYAVIDGMHFHDSYPTGTYNYVGQIAITGTRVGVQLTNAKVSLGNSTVLAGLMGVQMNGVDTLSMNADSLGGVGCMQMLGANSLAWVDNVAFHGCRTQSQGSLSFAIWNNAPNSSLSIWQSRFTHADMVPIYWQNASGSSLYITESVFAGGTPTVDMANVEGAIRFVGGANFAIRKSVLAGYRYGAINASASGAITLDSNLIVANGVGVRVPSTGSITGINNDLYDNDTAAVIVQGATGSSSFSGNFWGDQRGPRRSADPTATGDSLAHPAAIPAGNAAPTYPGAGAAARLRVVRGQRVTAPGIANATVRVIDAAGLPLAGVAVTFSCPSSANCNNSLLTSDPYLQPSAGFTSTGSVTTQTVTSRADGLAEVRVNLRGGPRSMAVNVAASGGLGATVTVVSTP